MNIIRSLVTVLILCLLLASTSTVVAQDGCSESLDRDPVETLIEPGLLEFIAGAECVSMPTGVSKLFFNITTIKSGQALTVAQMLDSAVIDGLVVTDMTTPILQSLALSPEFTDFLAQYEIEYVARNVPPAVPGETFDVIRNGEQHATDLSVFYRLHFSDALDLDVVMADLQAVTVRTA